MNNLFKIRARWTDASAAQFLRETILPALRQSPRPVAVDAWNPQRGVISKPKPTAPVEPKIMGLSSIPFTPVDQRAMREASLIASFYQGVSFTTGKAREEEFYLQRAMREGAGND